MSLTADYDDSEDLGAIAIFDIAVVCSIAAFLVFGSLYNWKIKGETGANIIPLRGFWTEIPFLVKVCWSWVTHERTI